jgi:hypothetical protein
MTFDFSKKKLLKIFFEHILIVVVFSILYYIAHTYFDKGEGFDLRDTDGKKQKITLYDCFHFSLVTQTTVGYGKLVANNIYTQIINTLQLLFIFFTFATQLAIF